MSESVSVGRITAGIPAGMVVFSIGMRVNALWRVRAWLPVFTAMPRMVRELARQPELGLLGARTDLAWRRATVVQYWESMDKLIACAADPEHEHLPARRAFNASARRSNPAVGIWHEAYVVDPSTAHVVYRNMAPFGLAAATRDVLAGPESALGNGAGEAGRSGCHGLKKLLVNTLLTI